MMTQSHDAGRVTKGTRVMERERHHQMHVASISPTFFHMDFGGRKKEEFSLLILMMMMRSEKRSEKRTSVKHCH
jgi:hypothetical protein